MGECLASHLGAAGAGFRVSCLVAALPSPLGVKGPEDVITEVRL